jgi:NAD(P)-dependent dehydrogenase (short-subunit alcohol dehydrogenase family)
MDAPSQYYRDKVAVVTGGASGVGLALAEAMLSYGAAKVVVADINEKNLERETARLNAAYPGKVAGVRCDVTKETDVQSMINEAVGLGGRVDFLFNNAGVGFGGYFDRLSNDDWAKAFALNFYGAVYGVRAVLPIMRQHGGGHIINVISGIAFSPMAQQTMYAATKAALNALTLALRYELWDEGIRVTSATPGTTATAIWKDVPPPANAQPPERSAQTILLGVARNERLVFGDEVDLSAAKICFNPDVAPGTDEYMLNVARKRRRGEWGIE